MRSALAVAAALVAVGVIQSSTADACSAPACWPGFITPSTGAEVPANVPGFYWRPVSDHSSSTPPDPSKLKLSTGAAPSTPLPITTTALGNGAYLIVPQQALTPQTYFLADESMCASTGLAGPSVSFTVTAAAPMPTYLGELQAEPSTLGALDVATPSGSCSAQVTARQVAISLAITYESIAWRDVLMFETVVDGEIWRAASTINTQVAPGSSWQGRATDLLYRTCESDDPSAQQGLAAGPHQVVMRARLPGGDVIASSDSITVELYCPGEGGDGGGDGSGDGGGSEGGEGGCSSTRVPTWPLLALVAMLALGRRGRRAAESRAR
jgi:hypothetical protein